jgi:hypothetical protein
MRDIALLGTLVPPTEVYKYYARLEQRQDVLKRVEP